MRIPFFSEVFNRDTRDENVMYVTPPNGSVCDFPTESVDAGIAAAVARACTP
jgi:hypothetical protein